VQGREAGVAGVRISAVIEHEQRERHVSAHRGDEQRRTAGR
jgi:hypothetical protein